MKVAILAGGKGTRLADPTDTHGIVPKPMVRVGDHPIIWHIMKHYEAYGYNDFTIACGHMSEVVNQYFSQEARQSRHEDVDWNITCVQTGEDTNTGGRIKRLAPYVGNETFMLTWGDGVSDVNLDELLAFHKSHGKLCTLTAVRPPARFGILQIEGDAITSFEEKPADTQDWINGAFFVCEPGIFEYIEGDDTLFEGDPMQSLAKDGELMAFRHSGFWKCMDTPKDRDELRAMWNSDNAPWKDTK